METAVVKKKNPLPVIIAIAVVIIAAVTTAVVLVVRSNSPERRAARQLELAEHYLDELDYEQAIIAYQAVIELDPNCVAAYLGLAEAYVETDELELALEILQEGYDETEDERIAERLEELKIQQAAQRTVVDGIIHNPYDIVDLDEEETEYLDTILAGCASGDQEGTAKLLGNEDFLDLLQKILGSEALEQNSTFRIIYNGYKIFVQSYSWEWDEPVRDSFMTIIPVDEGTGYLLYRRKGENHSGWSFGTAECSEAMFNGSFDMIYVYEDLDPAFADAPPAHIRGSAVNGLLDGDYVEQYEGDDHWEGNTFVAGRMQNIRQNENGEYIILYGEGENWSRSTTLNMGDLPPSAQLYYVYPMSWGSQPENPGENGMFVYPY